MKYTRTSSSDSGTPLIEKVGAVLAHWYITVSSRSSGRVRIEVQLEGMDTWIDLGFLALRSPDFKSIDGPVVSVRGTKEGAVAPVKLTLIGYDH